MSIKSFLDKAASAYYIGSPIITDEEFDQLAKLANYKNIGHSVSGGVVHPFRMYSLNKFYVGETQSPLKAELLIESLKLDGAAVALIYIEGSLEAIHTRGDGITGQDISHLIPCFPNVPKNLKEYDSIVQITGEVVAPKEIPNARNYASGALSLNSVEEFSTRDLAFIAYGVNPVEPESTYLRDMRLLGDQGFITVVDYKLDRYPTDGIVFRLNSNASFNNMGYTASHPRGAYALKNRKVGVVTKLLNVVWQIGKSGAVSPVAILEPVDIDGATVSRATLHNIAYINELNLELGCMVELVRSGEIIPRIVRRI